MVLKHIRQQQDRARKNMLILRLRKQLVIEEERLSEFQATLSSERTHRTLNKRDFQRAERRVYHHQRVCDGIRRRIQINSI